MSELLVLPQVDVTIRPANPGDLAFIDSLQKTHTKMVGWMPTKTLEGKISLGHVLVAESKGEPVGYIIGNDQYFKRDDLGIVYQLCVAPVSRRGFIGAALLKALFDRAAWGCKLFCCWCAQDIEANQFWEAMGFVPLAFRAGSEKKSRVHIFWQKRIREDDTTTPWWFPSKTTGGSIREDRLVLPIPPGTHWSDAKPIILPGMLPDELQQSKQLPAPRNRKSEVANRKSVVRRNGLTYDIPQPGEALAKVKPIEVREKMKQAKRKCHPMLASAARELRDRYLDEVNRDGGLLGSGKYDVARAIEVRQVNPSMKELPLQRAA